MSLKPDLIIGAGASPLLDGIQLWLELDEASGSRNDLVNNNDFTSNNSVGSAPGVGGGTAAAFASASSQWLSRVATTELKTGDINYTLACWAYLTDKGGAGSYRYFMSRSQNPVGVEYNLYYEQGTDRFTFEIWNAALTLSNIVRANAFGSPSVATWYLLIAWHDSVSNTINISVNDGTVNSTATTIVPPALDITTGIGRYEYIASRYHNGRLNKIGYWKNKILSASDRTLLFNSGNGVTWPFA